MVTRIFFAPHTSVYTAVNQPLRHHRREKEMIEPHALVGWPSLALIVPECPERPTREHGRSHFLRPAHVGLHRRQPAAPPPPAREGNDRAACPCRLAIARAYSPRMSRAAHAGAWSLSFSSPRTRRSTPPSTSRSATTGERRK